MKTPVWVLRETVLALHEQALVEFGGKTGIRDEGLLDSALANPKNLFAYGKPSLFGLAANYGFGLVKNHPFVDGNKRVSVAVAEVFVDLNAHRLVATDRQLESVTIGIADGSIRKQDATRFFEAHVKK